MRTGKLPSLLRGVVLLGLITITGCTPSGTTDRTSIGLTGTAASSGAADGTGSGSADSSAAPGTGSGSAGGASTGSGMDSAGNATPGTDSGPAGGATDSGTSKYPLNTFAAEGYLRDGGAVVGLDSAGLEITVRATSTTTTEQQLTSEQVCGHGEYNATTQQPDYSCHMEQTPQQVPVNKTVYQVTSADTTLSFDTVEQAFGTTPGILISHWRSAV